MRMPSKPIQWMVLTMLVAFWLVTRSQPVQPALTSNVTREQYDTALAKWNSLHVTEYEETVSLWIEDRYWGKWKVVVQSVPTAGHEAEGLIGPESITHFESLENPANVKLDRDSLRVTLGTVANMFGLAAYQLQQPHPYSDGGEVQFMQFDPTMGYPSYATVVGTWDGKRDISVENVKVLK